MDEEVKRFVEHEVEKNQAVIIAHGYDLQGFTEMVLKAVEAFELVAEVISKMISPAVQWFEEHKVELYEYFERKSKRHLYKLDFTRPCIRHQVLDRKPKRLIKKVIH